MNASVAPFPRLPLGVTILVLSLVLTAAAVSRLTGFANSQSAPPVIASASLTFSDLSDGGVAVRDKATGKVIARIAARDDGFLRMTLRLLVAGRQRDNLGPEKPFRLDELQGGRLQLTDTATGQELELLAFGPSNTAEFASLLEAAQSEGHAAP